MIKQKKFDFIIGIDSGTKTGIAVLDTATQTFRMIDTVAIHQALHIVGEMAEQYSLGVIVEDARKRKWFGKNSNAKMQGAGSIKRDCKIWEDFLKDYKIPYEMQEPKKGMTKMDKQAFAKLTGFDKQTSEHSRDAAMLVFGRRCL